VAEEGAMSSSIRLKTSKICENCGEPFFPFTKKGKFCGFKCTGEANGRMRAERARQGFAEPTSVRGARWVPLGKGQFALVDADQFEKVSQHFWHMTDHGVSTFIGRKHVGLHHFVSKIPPHIIVDHKDLDFLNNRNGNLRRATRATNGQNGRKHSRGAYTIGRVTSRHKGVWFDRTRRRWCALITAHRVRYPLGRFLTEVQAALAYNKAAKKLHGRFAHLNEVP